MARNVIPPLTDPAGKWIAQRMIERDYSGAEALKKLQAANQTCDDDSSLANAELVCLWNRTVWQLVFSAWPSSAAHEVSEEHRTFLDSVNEEFDQSLHVTRVVPRDGLDPSRLAHLEHLVNNIDFRRRAAMLLRDGTVEEVEAFLREDMERTAAQVWRDGIAA